MRAFVSLEPPQTVKKEIDEIQQKLKAAGLQAHWVKPEIIHLTLAFLGSVTPDKIEPIKKIIQNIASQMNPVKLKLSQLNCFPNPIKPRIIFIKLSGKLGKLNALAIKIRQQLKKENIWFDKKPFSAHLTLARIKKKQNLTNLVKKIKIKQVEFTASQITLTKSQLTDLGPIYTQIKTIALTKQPDPNQE
jgi:2'-5' RNA ligase